MRRIGGPITFRYAVRITVYDRDGNVKRRDEKLFRLRQEAVNKARDIRAQHTENEVISTIQVVKLSENMVVERFKSKNRRVMDRRR